MRSFKPSSQTVTISATDTSASETIDANASCVRVFNAGPGVAFVSFSDIADDTGVPIPAGIVEVLTKGNSTTVSAVSPNTTATVYVTTGEGL